MESGRKRARSEDVPSAAPAVAPAVAVDDAAGSSSQPPLPAPPLKAKKQRQLTPYEAAFRGFREALVDACKRGDALAALDVHDEMKKAKVLPTAFIYNTILAVCTRVTGRVEPATLAKAIHVFECMYTTRMHPAWVSRASAAVAQAVSDAAGGRSPALAGTTEAAAAAAAPKPRVGYEAGLIRSAQSLVLPSEAAYTSIIRLCVLAGQPADARHYFDRMLAEGVVPRLRTYAPLFQAHAVPGGDATQLDWLFADMRQRGIAPSQQEYAAYLTALGRCGRWDDVSSVLRDMTATVYVVKGPPPLDPNGLSWQRRAERRAREETGGASSGAPSAAAPAPPSRAPAAAHAAAGAGRGAAATVASDAGAEEDEEAMQALTGPSLLDTLEALFSRGLSFPVGPLGSVLVSQPPPPAGPSARSSSGSGGSASGSGGGVSSSGASEQWQWNCRRVRIDPAVGLCPLTGRRLQSLDLARTELSTLREQIEQLASPAAAHPTGSSSSGGSSSNSGGGNSRNSAFAQFQEWLDAHAAFRAGGRGFDVIIDGPNVGFANQNFSTGALMYTQIEAAVRKWERAGKRVLLVIGSRWLDPRYYARADKRRPVKQKQKDAKAAAAAAVAAAAAGAAVPTTVTTAAVPPVPLAARAQAVGGASAAVPPARPSGAAATAATSGGRSAAAAAPAVAASGGGGAPGSASSDGSECSSDLGSDDEEEDYDDSDGGDDHGGASPHTWGQPALECDPDDSYEVALDAADDSRHAEALIARWTAAGLVYRVHPGNNDDWYWLYAAVRSQAAADAAAAAAAGSGGRPGVYLISNDLMRDHHFAMLAPRAFLTWRERHQVRFAFEPTFERATRRRGFRLVFSPPTHHSHRAQATADGAVWHFPVSEEGAGARDVWLACWRAGDAAVSADALARLDAAAAAERELRCDAAGGGRAALAAPRPRAGAAGPPAPVAGDRAHGRQQLK